MSISKAAIDKLGHFSSQLSSIESMRDEEATRLRLEYQEKMEPLFIERQAKLSAIDGFWCGIMSSPETPLAPLMNGTIDPKIVRAIVSLNVLSSVKDNKLIRRVIITLRPNMFTEEGEIYREVDSNLKTVGIKAIQWKAGTERSRKDSMFSFFDLEPEGGAEFINEVLEAIDIVFRNPFLSIESD